jgi:hypothetical protein
LFVVYRQVASHLFKVKELKQMRNIFERHGLEVLQILDSYADTGKPVDIADLFFKYTLDSIGEIAFGYNVYSMCAPPPPPLHKTELNDPISFTGVASGLLVLPRVRRCAGGRRRPLPQPLLEGTASRPLSRYSALVTLSGPLQSALISFSRPLI